MGVAPRLLSNHNTLRVLMRNLMVWCSVALLSVPALAEEKAQETLEDVNADSKHNHGIKCLLVLPKT